MEHYYILMTLAIVFAFFMAWGIGANDVANAMGTSVGSKALTFKQAILVAAIFEAAGALLAGGQVTDTIRKGIIDASMFTQHPELLVYGMMACLLAAGTWLLVATYFGWPVSTTHSIVGAVVGFGVVELGVNGVHWHKTITIALSWIITPFIAGVIAYLLFRSVQKFVFDTPDPVRSAKRVVPWYIFLAAMIISTATFVNGLKHLNLHLTGLEGFAGSLAISILAMLVGKVMLNRIPYSVTSEKGERTDFKTIERVFGVLMIFTACSVAFAHGSNDVANAVGPLAAIVGILKSGNVLLKSPIPYWVLMLGATGIVLGLAMYGYRVIATIGTKITELTPSRGFAAELATASTVVIASGFGLPISTTQTLVGAVLGVGFARGIGALNLSVIRNIFLSWVLTLPAGAALAIVAYHLLKAIFS